MRVFLILCFLSLYSLRVHSQCNGQLFEAFAGFGAETTSGDGVIYFTSSSDIYRNDRMSTANLSNSAVVDEQIDSDGNTVVWSGSANSNFNIFKSVDGAPREILNTGTSVNNRNPAISGDLIVWSGIAGGFNIFKNEGSGQQQVSTSLSTSNGWPATDGANIVWHGLVGGVQRIIMESGSGPFVIDPVTPGVQTQAKIDNGVIIWRQINPGATTSQLYKYENGMTSIVSTGQTEVVANDYDIHDGTIVWINGDGASANAYASVNGGAPQLLSAGSTDNKNIRTSDGNIAWVGKDITDRVYLKEGSTTTMISENISTNQNLDFHQGVITWVGFRNSSWRVFARYVTQPADCCTSSTEVSVPADVDNRIMGERQGKLVWTGFDDNNNLQVYTQGSSGPLLISQGTYEDLQEVSVDGDNIYWVADNGGDIIKYDGMSETLISTSSIFERAPTADGSTLYWIGRPLMTNPGETQVYRLQSGIETILSSGTTNHGSLKIYNGIPYWVGRDGSGINQLYKYEGGTQVLLSDNVGFFFNAIAFISGFPVWVADDLSGGLQVYTNKGSGQEAVSPTNTVNDDVNEKKLLEYQGKLIWKKSGSGTQEIVGYDGTVVAPVDISGIPIKDILHINGSDIYYDQIIITTTYLNKWDGISHTRLTDGVQNGFRGVAVLNDAIFYEATDRTNPSVPVVRIYKLNCSGDCPDMLAVPTVSAPRYGAGISLTSDAMITGVGTTLFSSGEEVVLSPEFSVMGMRELHIIIQSCADYLLGN